MGSSPIDPHTGQATSQVAAPLLALTALYGGMTCIAGVLGSKQVALGPLAVEAGIFPFLMLVSISSAVSVLYGKAVAQQLVRFGFIPLLMAIFLTFLVLRLPTDDAMWEPAKAAFPIVLGQSWRLMITGIIAYGASMTLNVAIFAALGRLTGAGDTLLAVRGAVASMASQVVDTLIFITLAFWGVRPIGELLLGQATAKAVLSVVLVPLLIRLLVSMARKAAR